MSDETTGAESAATIPGRAPGWTPGNPGGTDTVNAPVHEDGPPTVVDGPALTPDPAGSAAAEQAAGDDPHDDAADGDNDEVTAAPPPTPVVPPPPRRTATWPTTTGTTGMRARNWRAWAMLALVLMFLGIGVWLITHIDLFDPPVKDDEAAEIGRLVDGYIVHPGSFRDHRGTLMVDGTGRELRCQQLDADASGALRGVRASCMEVSAPR